MVPLNRSAGKWMPGEHPRFSSPPPQLDWQTD